MVDDETFTSLWFFQRIDLGHGTHIMYVYIVSSNARSYLRLDDRHGGMIIHYLVSKSQTQGGVSSLRPCILDKQNSAHATCFAILILILGNSDHTNVSQKSTEPFSFGPIRRRSPSYRLCAPENRGFIHGESFPEVLESLSREQGNPECANANHRVVGPLASHNVGELTRMEIRQIGLSGRKWRLISG